MEVWRESGVKLHVFLVWVLGRFYRVSLLVVEQLAEPGDIKLVGRQSQSECYGRMKIACCCQATNSNGTVNNQLSSLIYSGTLS
jgi:hypothetical protein